MSAVDLKRRFPHILALILLLVIGWSAWRPAEWGVWWMEMVWVLGTFAVLAATYCRFRFSNLAYGIVFLWLVMHAVGAHYTFERVPMAWLMERFGSERNHYDRIAHFCIGLNGLAGARAGRRGSARVTGRGAQTAASGGGAIRPLTCRCGA